MTGFIETALSRSRLVLAALIFILLAGWIAWRDIPKESEPDVRIPIIFVRMTHEGISPEDAERLLVRPMEQELRSIEGIKEMRSTAYEGAAVVVLEFDAGFDSEKALSDVREKVDQAAPELPQDADEPSVHEVNISLFPVLAVTLSGDVPERTLLQLARNLRDRIESIPAILEAQIVGTRDEMIEIVIDPVKAESYGLSAEQTIELVNRSNQIIAAGALESGEGGRFAIKVPGLLEDITDIVTLPLVVQGDRVVRIGDVAEVRRTFKDRQNVARVNGKQAVVLEVSKRTGSNIIDTIAEVRRVVEAERANWPEGVTVGYSQDESEDIRGMLDDLENNLALAVVLVLIIVLGSLGWRTTTLVAVAVPGSFLAGILMLAGMGLTINIVVLFGLIFAAGNVVDGAIVVTEYADARMAEGMDRRRAYALAAKRMAWPIIASTATQLAAFLPLLFWPGVVGEFMKYLPISQFVTMGAALAMALIFVPVLGAMFGRSGGGTASVEAVRAIQENQIDRQRGLTGAYVRMLNGTLRWPGTVLLGAVALLVAVTFLYGAFGRGVEFFPNVEPARSLIAVHARGNLSISEQDALVREVEEKVLQLQAERGEFASIYTRTGRQDGGNDNLAPDVIGTVTLEFADWRERRKADEIIADILQRTKGFAGIVVDSQKEDAGPPVGKPIQIELSSRDPELILPAVAQVRDKLATMDGVINIEDTRPLPGIQWSFEVDRAQAAKFGADVTAIGNMLKLVTNGLIVSDYRPTDSDEEIDIVVRYPAEDRMLEQLDRIRVQTEVGLVPISNFVRRVAEPQTDTINRVDQRRVITVKADVAPGVLPDQKVMELQRWIAGAGLDPRIEVAFKGEDEEQKKASDFLSKAFAGAVFLIFLILMAQFNSFYHTALILSAVVMSTFGVLIGLLLTGSPFGIVMSGIGVVALAGIVVANNIVLIDTFTQFRREGRPAREAILMTGAERLRPVLLTALNNVLGLMPLTFGINVDLLNRAITVGAPSSQWWVQLSQAIVYGLGFATVLTLVLTPCALMLRENMGRTWRRWRGREEEDGHAPVRAPLPKAAE